MDKEQRKYFISIFIWTIIIFIIGFTFGGLMNDSNHVIDINMDDNILKAIQSINYSEINEQKLIKYNSEDCIEGIEYYVCGESLSNTVYNENGNIIKTKVIGGFVN